jgi:chromosomal replication initiation ATPase DnaA
MEQDSIDGYLRQVRSLAAELTGARRRWTTAIRGEIEELERQLEDAKSRLAAALINVDYMSHVDRQSAGLLEMEAVCKEYGVSAELLAGAGKQKWKVEARQELMRRLRDIHKWQLKEIGHLLGGRNHATVIHGAQKARSRLINKDGLQTDDKTLQGYINGGNKEKGHD